MANVLVQGLKLKSMSNAISQIGKLYTIEVPASAWIE
jgi:hypothetical protein